MNTTGCSPSSAGSITPAGFLQIADVLPEACLLISGSGRVLTANRRAAARLEVKRDELTGVPLTDIVSESGDVVREYLRLCARARGRVPMTLTFSGHAEPRRVVGALLRPRGAHGEALIMLCIRGDDELAARFGALGEKLDQLNREIERRKQIEAELREQRDLAEFGRDIGLALTQKTDLDGMLQRCAELMVAHLGGAFARFWTLDEGSTTLCLRASAGLYTHLDGDHSRVEVGQYKIGLIAAERKPHLTNAVVGDSRISDQEWAKREAMVAFAGYPLVVGERLVGVTAMFARRPLSDSVLKAMDSIASGIALGIERIRVAEALKQHAAALHLADQRKNEFLAMLGHELRNPLVPIRSGLELLQIDPGAREVLAVMQEHVDHIVRMVDDLLDVSRISRGVIELRREPVRLAAVLERALTSTRPFVELKRHRLCVRQTKQTLWVNADRVRLTQVVSNLLHNAAKYTPAGGCIWLETAREADQAIIRVLDNGIGIERGFLDDAFELFAQSGVSLARSEGGLGIGLTVARKIIELHGGHIEAASGGLNQGSRFTVRLPLAEAPAQTRTRRSAPRPGGWRPELRVLIVDDSEQSAQVLGRLLTALGLKNVELAYDGHAALTAAQAFRPHVVFLDIGLPGLDGFEVARRLRADVGLAAATLVAITGYGSEHDRRMSQEAGFDLHLVKPVGVDQLKSVLAAAPGRA